MHKMAFDLSCSACQSCLILFRARHGLIPIMSNLSATSDRPLCLSLVVVLGGVPYNRRAFALIHLFF